MNCWYRRMAGESCGWAAEGVVGRASDMKFGEGMDRPPNVQSIKKLANVFDASGSVEAGVRDF